MFGFENVHWDKLSSGPLEEKCEYEYCLKTFEEIRRSFPDFYEYQFYLFSCGKLKIPDSTNYPGKKVLIYLSDESGTIPDKSICDSFLAIFKVYLDESKVKDICNLYGFPLGYSAGVKMEEIKSFDKRTNNVFFSGNLNKRRLLLYYKCLRLYEALKMGCIVISEKLPDCEYYKNSPILQVDGWVHIDTLINQLLSDEKKLQEIARIQYEYYLKHLSPEVAAHYIISRLRLHRRD